MAYLKRCGLAVDHAPHDHDTHVGVSRCDGHAGRCRIGTCDRPAAPGEVCRMHSAPEDPDLHPDAYRLPTGPTR